jgi:hypothetical protein
VSDPEAAVRARLTDLQDRLARPTPEPLDGQQAIALPLPGDTLTIMSSFQPAPGILYGIWNAVKNEDEWNERRWMEWWPSQAAAFRSMRERLCPERVDFTRGNVCVARHVFQEDREDAQFYGSRDGSCIVLYESPDAPEPCEVIEFGPRGGLRRRPYTPAAAPA